MGKIYEPILPWGRFHSERFFTVTADQDWAPEWATEFMLEWARSRSIPLHVFQTNASLSLTAAQAAGEVDLGWHPNFGQGSSHGSTPSEVALHMRENFGGATTFRSHGFSESYQALVEMAAAGIVQESQYPTAFSANIVPSVHATGLVRLPVWFEDDIWMRLAPNLESIEVLDSGFDSPGLKVLNLHPIHIALNAPSDEFYESNRHRIYSSDVKDPFAELGYRGYGVRDAVEEILDRVGADDEVLHTFTDVASLAQRISDSNGSRNQLVR